MPETPNDKHGDNDHQWQGEQLSQGHSPAPAGHGRVYPDQPERQPGTQDERQQYPHAGLVALASAMMDTTRATTAMTATAIIARPASLTA
jgi:hypothetical protein